MKLNIGDQVIFRASAEEQHNALFELIDGASATVTEVDSPIYAPFITFVEIKLDEPVELNGEMIKTDESFLELLTKLKTFYQKFKSKWAKVLASRKKTKKEDEE